MISLMNSVKRFFRLCAMMGIEGRYRGMWCAVHGSAIGGATKSRSILTRKPVQNCELSAVVMNSASTVLHGSQARRPTSPWRGASRIAVIYLIFAIGWISFANFFVKPFVDESRVPYLETIEYIAFALGSAVLLYVLVVRFARQRAVIEDALRRNERRYRSLVLATAQVTWRGEANGEIAEEQPTWEAFTGQTFAQYRGWGWLEAIHPDDRAMLSERWRKAVARESRPPNDRYYEIEYRVRRRDGMYRNFVARTVPVLDPENRVQEWVGICFDITEQKLHEAQLRDSEERYRNLVDIAPDMIFVHQQGRIIFMNPAGLRMLRAPSLESVIGKNAIDLAHPDFHDIIRERIRQTASGQKVPTMEQKLVRFDGTTFDAEVGATGFLYHGQPSVQVVARDITARLRAQEELKASETRFNLVTRATTDVVYDWDMATNAIWWNENLRIQFGYEGKPEELGITFWTSLIHPEDAARIDASLSGAVTGGKKFWADEYRFRRTDGSYASVLDRGYIVHDASGKAVRMIGAMMDITDRKQTEQRLRDSREQARALTGHLERIREDERTRIAREIHDELGQALTGLKMDLSWFASRLPNQPALTEKSAAMLKLIDSTVHAVRRLSTELRPAILDNLGLIPAIEWLAQEFQKRTGVVCEFDADNEELTLDEQRTTALFRVCQEALTNVTRYAQASAVKIELTTVGEEMVLRIHDNGRGITDAEARGTKSFGLLGMRERARLLGGTLEIHGEKGAGTTLTMRIPAPQAAPAILNESRTSSL
jgi:PAS domain S-box-containing protein